MASLFNPISAETRKITARYALPENSWAGAMIAPFFLGTCHNAPSAIMFIVVVLPFYISLALSIAMQIAFVVYFHRVVHEEGRSTECLPDLGIMQFCCTSLLVSILITGDLIETLHMYLWWSHVPHYDESAHKPIIEEYGLNMVFAEEEVDGVQVIRPATGMTKFYTAFIVFLLICKISIAFVVMYYGAGFFLLSESVADLILNSAAAVFILDVDEIMFKLCVPRFTSGIFALVPEIAVLDRHASSVESLGPIWTPVGIPFICGALVFGVQGMWCNEEENKSRPLLAIGLGLGIPLLCCTGCCCAGHVKTKSTPDDTEAESLGKAYSTE